MENIALPIRGGRQVGAEGCGLVGVEGEENEMMVEKERERERGYGCGLAG